MKCSQSNIIALEKSEILGTVSFKKLEKVAQAMNCKLVYCLVPIKTLEQTLEDQARNMAQEELKSIHHSMALEAQNLSLKQKKQQEDLLVE